jgi:hypothetical protein
MNHEESTVKIPELFLCPITYNVIIDPVIDHEGNSYEYKAIRKWLTKNKTSPVTRNKLLPHQLIPNRALRDIIHKFLNDNNLQFEKPEHYATTTPEIIDLTYLTDLTDNRPIPSPTLPPTNIYIPQTNIMTRTHLTPSPPSSQHPTMARYNIN